MTARLPEEPVRVTNWLAGWLDYVCATVITAGRWFRLPASRGAQEPAMLAAFAPTMDAYRPQWHEGAEDEPGSGRLVRALEIVMLSVSFFLAAHLLSGGTPTVSAPNVGFGFSGSRPEAAALAVPASPGRQVTFDASGFLPSPPAAVADETLQATATDAPPPAPTEAAAVLAPASAPAAASAGVAPASAAPPAQAAAVEPPAPAPVAEEPPVAVSSTGVPAEADRYLTRDEFRAAALTAGWPAALLPELETVAQCESHFRTGAFHLGARGLMQVLPNWFAFAGLDVALWYDPVTNLTAALAAYNEHTRYSGDGWSGWTCRP